MHPLQQWQHQHAVCHSLGCGQHTQVCAAANLQLTSDGVDASFTDHFVNCHHFLLFLLLQRHWSDEGGCNSLRFPDTFWVYPFGSAIYSHKKGFLNWFCHCWDSRTVRTHVKYSLFHISVKLVSWNRKSSHELKSENWKYRVGTAILELMCVKWSSALLRSPHLAEAISMATLCALRFCFSLTAHDTLKKTRPAGYFFWCKHSESKGSDIIQETVTNYDTPSWHVSAITSYEGFIWNQPVSLCCYVLCSQQQSFFYFYDWLKFYYSLGLALKRGGQWHHFTTTLAKPNSCSVSSALQLKEDS